MRRLLVAALLLSPAVAGPAGAQGLEQVDSLTREGEVQRARGLLLDWFDARADDAGRDALQRALWLRGILTLDPGQAEVDFTRLALEYPGGTFSDQALARLARAARARGELTVAARHYRRLARDYPSSPARLEARRWLDRNAGAIAAEELRLERAGPAPDADGASPGGTPDSRTPSSAPAPAAPASDGRGAPQESEDRRNLDNPPVEEGPFTVQMGAFSDEEGARSLALRLAEAGISARLVTVGGSELIRVRAGRFDGAAAATRLYDRVTSAGFDALVVADAQREVPYR